MLGDNRGFSVFSGMDGWMDALYGLWVSNAPPHSLNLYATTRLFSRGTLINLLYSLSLLITNCSKNADADLGQCREGEQGYGVQLPIKTINFNSKGLNCQSKDASFFPSWITVPPFPPKRSGPG